MSELKTVEIVEILPTKVWIESDICGGRHVMRQHQGYEPFTYATFHYDYSHTSNSQTWADAKQVALAVGATEPVEQRQRGFPAPESLEKLEQRIADLQSYLEMRKKGASAMHPEGGA